MSENQLLMKRVKKQRSPRTWVKDLVPKPQCPLSYFEIDIKFIHIQGSQRNAMVLTAIDVMSRWVLGQIQSWSISKNDVIKLFDQNLEKYLLPEKIYVRNDNGTQFAAQVVQQYFADKRIVQEFTKPATPEQNAYNLSRPLTWIESYHSIVESVICYKY